MTWKAMGHGSNFKICDEEAGLELVRAGGGPDHSNFLIRHIDDERNISPKFIVSEEFEYPSDEFKVKYPNIKTIKTLRLTSLQKKNFPLQGFDMEQSKNILINALSESYKTRGAYEGSDKIYVVFDF